MRPGFFAAILVLALAGGLAACAGGAADRPPSVGGGSDAATRTALPIVETTGVPPTIRPDALTPGVTPSLSIRIGGTVKALSDGSHRLQLEESNEGFDTIVLTDGTELLLADGRTASVSDLRPGARVEASGVPREDGTLLAQRVTIVPSPGAVATP